MTTFWQGVLVGVIGSAVVFALLLALGEVKA